MIRIIIQFSEFEEEHLFQNGRSEVGDAYRLEGQGEMIWLQNSETDIPDIPERWKSFNNLEVQAHS